MQDYLATHILEELRAIRKNQDDLKEGQSHHAVLAARVDEGVKALAGPEGRVTKLENTNTRQWWLHALSPALLGAYAVAKKLGLAI